MQIVIEIPEKTVNEIKDNAMFAGTIPSEILWDVTSAIVNGKPLPKGHGRIADMDEAIKCIEEVTGEDAIWAIGLIEWACSKRTIIEAEKEESHGRNNQ